jgi:hypothetical protein
VSQLSAEQARLIGRENTSLPAGAGRALALGAIGLGVVAILATLGLILFGGGVAPKQALASYHVGFLFCVGLSVGALGIVMILHQTNAGWSAAARRTAEQMMGLMPLCLLLGIPVLLFAPKIFRWMDPEYVAGDVIYDHKAAYLNTSFFVIRFFIYFAVWIWLAMTLRGMSLRQDQTGDRWLTAKMRRRSSYGLLLFAFTVAFAGFDWMMSLDFHWFSTMLGVYFFAGSIAAAFGFWTFTLLLLRRAGRLEGLVTVEHFHDLGKLMFGFTVFWAYIGFSQYFLIWYGNIPEETAFYWRRRQDGWMAWSIALCTLRFIVPFLILLPRPARRNLFVLGSMAVLLVVAHLLDLFWFVRPQVYAEGYEPVFFGLIDVVAMLGPVLVFAGLFVLRLASAPVAPVNDPRLDEAIVHKNYI